MALGLAMLMSACGIQAAGEEAVDGDGHVHPAASPEFQAAVKADHDGVMKLASVQPSHKAIKNGRWSEPGTWQNGQVPGNGANVLIPEGIQVSYNTAPTVALQTVRIDGVLDVPSWAYSEMTADTMLVMMTGRLQVGAEDAPVERGAHFTFSNNGDINTGWDPKLLSRGLVAMGEVKVYGAKKTSFVKVASDPRAGATTLNLAKAPTGWSPGDEIVLTGTHKRGHGINSKQYKPELWAESEDEILVIRSINGTQVTVDRPLRHNHDTPASDLKAYVANLTRNVTFKSQNGAGTPVHQRGHVMLMNPNSEVSYASFNHLGRTDKSRESKPDTAFSPIRSDSNVQGRYSLHLHRTGVEAADMDNPVRLIGNVANGSPGWGIVQHSSHALFAENVAFDVFGGAFVAESNNDSGVWVRNIAIKSIGRGGGGPGHPTDAAINGDGFHFQSRILRAVDNVAANVQQGYVYDAEGHSDGVGGTFPFRHQLEQPEIAHGEEQINTRFPTLNGFRDNEVFGAHLGFYVERVNSPQNNDLRSHIQNFTAWEVREGTYNRYSPHYTLENIRLIGTTTPHADGLRKTGMSFDRKAFDQVINGATIENFAVGAHLWGPALRDTDRRHGSTFIGVEMRNVDKQYSRKDGGQRFMSPSQLADGQLAVAHKRIDPIRANQDVYIDWLKADSVGTVGRQWDYDAYRLSWKYGLASGLVRDGFYRLADGSKVYLHEDFASDRASAEFIKMITPIPVEMSDQELSQMNVRDNGSISLGGPTPQVGSETVRVSVNGETVINVLANDSDPDGGRVWVDGFKHPDHGMIFLTDDDKVRYVPFPEYAGTDRFSYWVRDEEGNISRGEVSIRVGDGSVSAATPVRATAPANLAQLAEINRRPVAWQERSGQNKVGQSWNLLANDVDPEGDELFLTSIRLGGRSGGMDVRLDENDKMTITKADPGTSVNFVYEMSDGNSNFDDGFIQLSAAGTGPKLSEEQASRLNPRWFDGSSAGWDSFVSTTVLDAATDRPIGEMSDMMRYGTGSTGAAGISISATTSFWDVGSMVFHVDGQQTNVDNSAPFTAFGENGSDIRGRVLAPGTHVVRIQGFTGDNGTGNLLFEERARIVLDESNEQANQSVGRLVFNYSNLCATAEGGVPAPGVNVVHADCFYAQPVELVPVSGGMQARIGGYCMDVAGGNNGSGASVGLWRCVDGAANQILNWSASKLTFKHSGKCLDLSGEAGVKLSTRSSGSDVVQKDCTNTRSQYVRIAPTGAAGSGVVIPGTPTPGGPTTTIGGEVSAGPGRLVLSHSGMCVGGEGNRVALGVNVVQVDCANAPVFELVSAPGGFQVRADGQCLDLAAGRTNRGEPVGFWRCVDGVDGQIASWSGGSLKFKHSELCVDVTGSSTAAADIIQWTCNYTPNQTLTVQAADGGGSSSPTTRPSVTTTRPAPATSTTQPAPTTAPPGGGSAGSKGRLVLSHSGMCVGGEGNRVALGVNVVQVDCANAPVFELVSVPGGFQVRADGQCLDLAAGRTNRGEPVGFWRCVDGVDGQIASWSGGSLKFKHSELCVDVTGSSTAAGADIIQWTCNYTPNQTLTVRPVGSGG